MGSLFESAFSRLFTLSRYPIHELILLLGRYQLQEAALPVPILCPVVRSARPHDPDGPRPPQADTHEAGNHEARDGK